MFPREGRLGMGAVQQQSRLNAGYTICSPESRPADRATVYLGTYINKNQRILCLIHNFLFNVAEKTSDLLMLSQPKKNQEQTSIATVF